MDHNLLAVQIPLGNFEGVGPLGQTNSFLSTDVTASSNLFAKVLTVAVGVMTIVAIIWFLFVLVAGAISWLSSGGDKNKLQESQKKITTGLAGLVIVIAAIFIIRVVGYIFGFDILNIQQAINGLW